MNDLQISLSIIGLFIIVGVIGFNRWQERKHRQRLENSFVPPTAGATPLPPAYEARQEPTINAPLPTEPPAELVSATIDTKLNYVVSMDAAEFIPTDYLKMVFSEHGFNRRILWQGFNESTRQWDPLNVPGRYQRLSVGVPLVDRLGAITDNELQEFYGLIKELAEKWMAVIDLPSRQDALQSAKELDEFCMLADVSVGINIISPSGEAFSLQQISEVAFSLDMQKVRENEYHRLDDNGVEIYTLSTLGFLNDPENPTSAHGLTFLFDVPLVANGLDAFDEMLAYARVAAGTLSGLLVDDNRRALSDAGIEKIRQQISEIYAAMENEQIPPGSPRAVSLFS